MTRANPAELRRMLEMATLMAKSGILFVPMPVTSVEEYVAKNVEVYQFLDQLEKGEEVKS